MFDVCPCTICGETGHRVGKCNELWQNKVPPPERGDHGDDEDDSLRVIIILKKVSRDLKIILV